MSNKTVKVRMRRELHEELKVMFPKQTDAERMDRLWGTSTLQITNIIENVLAKKSKKKK